MDAHRGCNSCHSLHSIIPKISKRFNQRVSGFVCMEEKREIADSLLPTTACHVGPYRLSKSFLIYAAICRPTRTVYQVTAILPCEQSGGGNRPRGSRVGLKGTACAYAHLSPRRSRRPWLLLRLELPPSASVGAWDESERRNGQSWISQPSETGIIARPFARPDARGAYLL